MHGNPLALAAVLDDLRGEDVELVVWMGDLSWGSEPTATLELVREVDVPALFVRGNAERFLLELRDGRKEEPTERESWMLARHTPEDLDFVGGFEHSHSVDVEGLGPTYFTHGSPRSDEELLTERTPESRVRAATSGITEAVLVTGHTHVRYDRRLADLRALNPGSVGLPYEGEQGAFWALLGPDVEHRRTAYDVDEAVARMQATGAPLVEQFVEVLLEAPTRDEAIEHAERHEFSG